MKISEKIVRQLIAEAGLHVIKKKHRRFSRYRGEFTRAPANELGRNVLAEQPNEKWLIDITEMTAADGKIYLSPVRVCFDGMVINWEMSRNQNTRLTNGMLKDAINALPNKSKPILRTDRGVNYRWPSWVHIAEQAKLVRSMSKKACSLDNADVKGFSESQERNIFRTGLGKTIRRSVDVRD